ncbi:MAG: ZIP family metal transporter [Sphingomonas sp.]|nr:ZIP family metal transporter [Sphingomonas sp.]
MELVPRTFEGLPPWAAGLAILAGGGAFLLLDASVEKLTSRSTNKPNPEPVRAVSRSAGAWMIYAAVSLDLFSDGLLIGAGSSLSFELALVLAIGQVTADIPEGFAAVANFKDKGMPRSRRLLMSASFAVPILIAALASWLLLRGQDERVQLIVLAFIAGLLLVAATEEIMGEAHEAACDTKRSVMAIVGGFVLFALVSSYFEA